MMGSVLTGVRVLDFGRYIAAPYCAALLADLGAEVIRVERAGGGEDRSLAPVSDGGDGALFLQCNAGKKSLTLNPTEPGAKAIYRRLIATADVVVAAAPPPTLKKIGLDYPSLVEIKPNIILTVVTAFGPGGPSENRIGFDALGQAMSGSMYLSGPADEPTKAFVNYVDFSTGLSSALATLAALMERQRTGKGQIVETSLLGSALVASNIAVIEQALKASNRRATRNRSQYSAPSDTFRTRDGWVTVQCAGSSMFERWARLIGDPSWIDRPDCATDAARAGNGQAISERMARWCADRSTRQVLDELVAARIPAGPVYSPQQVLDDEHVRAAGFYEPLDYPGLPGPAPIMRFPARFAGEPIDHARRAPTAGEHTDSIMSELGYSSAELAALRAAGCV